MPILNSKQKLINQIHERLRLKSFNFLQRKLIDNHATESGLLKDVIRKNVTSLDAIIQEIHLFPDASSEAGYSYKIVISSNENSDKIIKKSKIIANIIELKDDHFILSPSAIKFDKKCYKVLEKTIEKNKKNDQNLCISRDDKLGIICEVLEELENLKIPETLDFFDDVLEHTLISSVSIQLKANFAISFAFDLYKASGDNKNANKISLQEELLHIASISSMKGAVSILLDGGTDPNSVVKSGERSVPIIKLLSNKLAENKGEGSNLQNSKLEEILLDLLDHGLQLHLVDELRRGSEHIKNIVDRKKISIPHSIIKADISKENKNIHELNSEYSTLSGVNIVSNFNAVEESKGEWTERQILYEEEKSPDRVDIDSPLLSFGIEEIAKTKFATEKTKKVSEGDIYKKRHFQQSLCNLHSGNTDLHVAADTGDVDKVKELLTRDGIDVNKKNDYGETPFLLATRRGHAKVVELLLLDTRVNVNLPDKDEHSPLYFAAMTHEKIVQLLLTHNKIQINKTDKDRFTPLHMAIEHNKPEIVKMLLQHKDIDVICYNITPLYSAASRNYKEIVELLLNDPRVDVNQTDRDYVKEPKEKSYTKVKQNSPTLSGSSHRSRGGFSRYEGVAGISRYENVADNGKIDNQCKQVILSSAVDIVEEMIGNRQFDKALKVYEKIKTLDLDWSLITTKQQNLEELIIPAKFDSYIKSLQGNMAKYEELEKLLVDELSNLLPSKYWFSSYEIYIEGIGQIVPSNNIGNSYLGDANKLLTIRSPQSMVKSGTHSVTYFTKQDGSNGNVCYKHMPYAPGIEFAVNSLNKILLDDISLPTRLIKIKKTDVLKTNVAYYQASSAIVGENLHNVLSDSYYLDLIDMESFSALVISSLLTGSGDAKPDNFIARFEKDEQTGEIKSIKLIGIDNDIAFCNGRLGFKNYAKGKAKIYSDMLNVLYFFPQMDQPLDPKIRKSLVSRSPEEIVSLWLKGLYEQNERYNSLKEVGFTDEDLDKLKLPIKLPSGTIESLYERLCILQSKIRKDEIVTHNSLFKEFYPSVGEYYALKRSSYKKGEETEAIKQLYIEVCDDEKLKSELANSDKMRSQMAWKTASMSKMMSHEKFKDRFNSNIEELAMEFLESLDFEYLAGGNRCSGGGGDSLICRKLGDNLSFVKNLRLKKINVSQLEMMFSGVWRFSDDLAISDGTEIDSMMVTNRKKFKVEKIQIIGWDKEKEEESMKMIEIENHAITKLLKDDLGVIIQEDALDKNDDNFGSSISFENLANKTKLTAINNIITKTAPSSEISTADISNLKDDLLVLSEKLIDVRKISDVTVEMASGIRNIRGRIKAADKDEIKELFSRYEVEEFSVIKQINLMVLDSDALIAIVLELARKGILDKKHNLLQRFVSYPKTKMDKYVEIIEAMVESSSGLLLVPLAGYNHRMLLCDLLKERGHIELLSAVLNIVKRSHDSFDLTSLFGNNLSKEEILIMKASELGYAVTTQELRDSRYDFDKLSDGKPILEKAIEPESRERLELFRLALDVIKERNDSGNGNMGLQEAYSMIWGNGDGKLKIWEYAIENKLFEVTAILYEKWDGRKFVGSLYDERGNHKLIHDGDIALLLKYYYIVGWEMAIEDYIKIAESIIECNDVDSDILRDWINKVNEKGNSLLYEMLKLGKWEYERIDLGKEESISWILERGADPLLTERRDAKNSLDFALRSGQEAIYEKLGGVLGFKDKIYKFFGLERGKVIMEHFQDMQDQINNQGEEIGLYGINMTKLQKKMHLLESVMEGMRSSTKLLEEKLENSGMSENQQKTICETLESLEKSIGVFSSKFDEKEEVIKGVVEKLKELSQSDKFTKTNFTVLMQELEELTREVQKHSEEIVGLAVATTNMKKQSYWKQEIGSINSETKSDSNIEELTDTTFIMPNGASESISVVGEVAEISLLN